MHILLFLTLATVICGAALITLMLWSEGRLDIKSIKQRLIDLFPGKETKPQVIRVSASDEVDSFICAVVGESFTNEDCISRQHIIRKHVRPGDAVRLQREPENPVDSSAVAVFSANGQIGYLKTDVAGRLSAKLDTGKFVAAAVVYEVNGGTRDKPSYGVTLELTIYRAPQT
ncbi:HIRAN domain-containing protein [Pseudomonas sp. RIT-PI-AD]|uniref:HIRAN domain-containing protein n=1 Tax=Pseudomonas sp. RIT-PI-AD TaxID=3035294 RepID=UPI0021D826F5|nr:HIRAN domain-containing protein [Pseudomonas sp. RIT-PI-AD]